MGTNQRVIVNKADNVDEAAGWLDSLIGNFVGAEAVTGIIHFQIIPEPDHCKIVVAVTTEIADAPSNFYGDDDPDKPYEPWH